MRDDLRDRLKTSFSAPHLPGDLAGPRPEEAAAPADRFVQAFLGKAERIVYPAMLEVGRLIESHGRFFSIELIGERMSGRGIAIPTSVQMNFFRRHRTTNYKHGCPHFNVVCDREARRVLFQRSVMRSGLPDQSESCGQCSLARLTGDLVQEKIAATLEALTAG